MGVAPFNIASSGDPDHGAAAGAQALRNCKQPVDCPTRSAARRRLQGERPRRQLEAVQAGRLRALQGNGYKGRVGIYQVMPITEDDPATSSLKSGNCDGHRRAGAERRRARPAPVGPAQGQAGHDVARRSARLYQRIAVEAERLMATGTLANGTPSGSRSRSRSSTGKARTRTASVVSGEMRAGGEAVVARSAAPAGHHGHQGQEADASARGKKIKREGHRAVFTRQLSTMMKAGVPLLQSFDIVARGHCEPVDGAPADRHPVATSRPAPACPRRSASTRCTSTRCTATWSPPASRPVSWKRCSTAWRSTRKRRWRSRARSSRRCSIRSSVIVVAFVVTAVIMIFVIPAFKSVFTTFGADLPAPTLVVIAMSDFFVAYWYADLRHRVRRRLLLLAGLASARPRCRLRWTALLLKLPVFGELISKASIARWTRTLSTMFAAGVPLVEALDSVGGASGNAVYAEATKQDPEGGLHRHQPDARRCRTPACSRTWCCR